MDDDILTTVGYAWSRTGTLNVRKELGNGPLETGVWGGKMVVGLML